MNVLVTGGNGYIGSSLLKELCKSEKYSKIYTVTRMGSDNKNIPVSKRIIQVEYDGTVESLSEAVKDSNSIAHLGAFYSTRKDTDTVNRLLKSNLEFSVHLFQAIALHNPDTALVSTSTFSSFDEDYKYVPQSFYAATKSAIEVLAAGFGLDAAFLRLPDTYGPMDWRPKVHNLLRDAVIKEDPCFDFMKPQTQQMNMIHVNDVVRAILHTFRIIKEDDKNDVKAYDLFYPENNISLEDLSDLIIKGSKTSVSFPMFGEVSPLPPQKHVLPLFALEYNPNNDLAKTIFNEVK